MRDSAYSNVLAHDRIGQSWNNSKKIVLPTTPSSPSIQVSAIPVKESTLCEKREIGMSLPQSKSPGIQSTQAIAARESSENDEFYQVSYASLGPFCPRNLCCLPDEAKQLIQYRWWGSLRIRANKIICHKYFDNGIMVLILASSFVLVSVNINVVYHLTSKILVHHHHHHHHLCNLFHCKSLKVFV